MNKKLIIFGIISMFFLTSISIVTAITKEIIQKQSNLSVDLELKFHPWLNDDGKQIGFVVKVKNVGNKAVEGRITASVRGYKGFNKIIPLLYWFGGTIVLKEGEMLNVGEEKDVIDCIAGFHLTIGIHINIFVVKLNFEDENLNNNYAEQRTFTILIPPLFVRFPNLMIQRMFFI